MTTSPPSGTPAAATAAQHRQRVDQAKDRALTESRAILANAPRWPDLTNPSRVRADATVFEQPVETVPLDAYEDEAHE